MIKLLLLALLALPLFGQGTVTSMFVGEKTDRAFVIRGTISTGLSNNAERCAYDYDTVALDRLSLRLDSNSTRVQRTFCVVNDGDPGAKIYVGPQTSDATKTAWSTSLTCTGICTNCNSGDASFFGDDGSGGSGLNCDGAGEFPYIQMDAEDTDPEPDPPVHAADPNVVPAVTGGSYQVAANCSDVASQKAAAEADAADGDVVEILFPAGVECPITGWEIENIANGGLVIVRSDADPKLLPPPGAMIDPTYRPHMGRITWDNVTPSEADGNTNRQFIWQDSTAGRGYRFENMDISPPALDSTVIAPQTMTITGVSGNNITVDSIPASVVNGDVVVVDFTGTGIRGGYGAGILCGKSGNTFHLRTGNPVCNGTTVVLSGTYGSGGSVKKFVALPISALADCGDGEQCATITAHGLPNFPTATVTGSTATSLTFSETASEYQIGNNTAVLVEGTQAGCDGTWKCTLSGSTCTLSKTGETPTCSGVSSGTIRRIKAISVFKTTSDTLGDHEPQAFNYFAEDANTVRLLDTPVQAGASGGWLFWDVRAFGFVVSLPPDGGASTRKSEVVFDRVLFDGCMPWTGSFFSWNAVSESAIVNSWLVYCGGFNRVNPVSGSTENTLSVTGNAVDVRRVEDFQYDNNFTGINPVFFADDCNDTTPGMIALSDTSITRSYLWKPDWTNQRTGVWRNHQFLLSPYMIEWKCGSNRSLFSGNYFKGWYSNFATASALFQFSSNGSGNSDGLASNHNNLEFSYNVADRGSTFLWNATSTYRSTQMHKISGWFKVAHNLVINIDTTVYDSSGSNNAGWFFGTNTGYYDAQIIRNTWVPKKARQSQFLLFDGGRRSSGTRVNDNIATFTGGITSFAEGVEQTPNSTEVPARSGSNTAGIAGFNEYHGRGTGSDPLSSFTGNIHIPGIETSVSGTFAVKAASDLNADTISVDELYDRTQMVGLDTGNTPAGSATACSGSPSTCPDSFAERLDLTFQAGSYRPISPTYDGKGADIDAINDAMGVPGPVTVTADDNEFTLAYHAPTTTGCWAQRAPWDTDWATTWSAANVAGISAWTQDASASQTQTINFGTLTAETEYAWRLYCRKGAIGKMTTAGTP